MFKGVSLVLLLVSSPQASLILRTRQRGFHGSGPLASMGVQDIEWVDFLGGFFFLGVGLFFFAFPWFS